MFFYGMSQASKFCASKVPFPYRSREVFERTIEMPIGRDYNTDKSTRDMTRPSVSTKLSFPPYPLSLPKPHLVLAIVVETRVHGSHCLQSFCEIMQFAQTLVF
jgi:hypothetical protein